MNRCVMPPFWSWFISKLEMNHDQNADADADANAGTDADVGARGQGTR